MGVRSKPVPVGIAQDSKRGWRVVIASCERAPEQWLRTENREVGIRHGVAQPGFPAMLVDDGVHRDGIGKGHQIGEDLVVVTVERVVVVANAAEFLRWR